jgi:hypothetical protein
MSNHEKEDYEEGKVELEAELIEALSEIKRERKKTRLLNKS